MSNYKIIKLNFEEHKLPEFKEVKNKDYVLFGNSPKYKNRYPDYLVELKSKSSKHNAILNAKVKYIFGRGLDYIKDGLNLEQKQHASHFINSINPDESANELLRKVVLDYEMFDGFYLEVIKSKDGKKIHPYHLDFTKIRTNADQDLYFYTEDWSSRKPEDNEDYTEFYPFPWDIKSMQSGKRYIIAFKQYRPNMGVYPLPGYIGAVPYIEADYEISNFVLNNVKNGFSAGYIVNFHNGQPDDEARQEIDRQFKDYTTGSDNAGQVILNFADGKDRGAEILPIPTNGQDDRFISLNDQIQSEIFVGHSVTNPMLMGVKTQGQLGGRTEIIEAYEMFKNTYVWHKQKVVIDIFNEIAQVNQIRAKLFIEELPPISTGGEGGNEVADTLSRLSPVLASKVLESMTPDEIRSLGGLKPIVKSKFSAQDECIDYLSRIGFKDEDYEVIKSRQVNFSSLEEAKESERYAFLDDTDERIISILKKTPEIPLSDIAKGLDITVEEVNTRVAEMIERGEVTEDLEPIEPQEEEFVILYKYAWRADVTPDIDSSRDWCRRVLNLGLSYTYDQLQGLKNDLKTDVFTTRGGWWNTGGTNNKTMPFCRHIWDQRLVRLKK